MGGSGHREAHAPRLPRRLSEQAGRWAQRPRDVLGQAPAWGVSRRSRRVLARRSGLSLATVPADQGEGVPGWGEGGGPAGGGPQPGRSCGSVRQGTLCVSPQAALPPAGSPAPPKITAAAVGSGPGLAPQQEPLVLPGAFPPPGSRRWRRSPAFGPRVPHLCPRQLRGGGSRARGFSPARWARGVREPGAWRDPRTTPVPTSAAELQELGAGVLGLLWPEGTAGCLRVGGRRGLWRGREGDDGLRCAACPPSWPRGPEAGG